MNYKKSVLESGITVLSVELPNLESATLTVWVGVGSRFENDKIAGLSHFLEHMSFKGSKKYPSAKIVSETIDAMGAVSNAGTAREWTNFYIKTRTGNIEKAFDIISDMLRNPFFKDSDIERERSVILEEIAMYEDTPIEKIGENFAKVMFGDTPLGRDIAGTVKSVKNIKKKDFVNYQGKHYCGRNLVITVSGGISDDKVSGFSEKYFGKIKAGEEEKPKMLRNTAKWPRVDIEYRKSEQAHFIIGFLGYPYDHQFRFPESLLSTILGSGRSSRLFEEVREKRGLAYAVSTSISRYVDTGVFATYAGVSPSNIEEAVKIIVDEHYKIKEKTRKITKKELNKAKDYMKGRLALALENTASVNSFFGRRALLHKEVETPEEVFKKVDEVGVDGIYEVAKDLFKPGKLGLAIIGPYNNKEKFKKLVS